MKMPESEWLTVAQFLDKHRGLIGRSALYDWLREGRVPHLRISRKILIPSDALDRTMIGHNTSNENVHSSRLGDDR